MLRDYSRMDFWTEYNELFEKNNFTESDIWYLYDNLILARETKKQSMGDFSLDSMGIQLASLLPVDRSLSGTPSEQSINSLATAGSRSTYYTSAGTGSTRSSVGAVAPAGQRIIDFYNPGRVGPFRGQGEANRHIVRLLSQKKYSMLPENKFPYKDSKFVLDDKEHAEQFRGFVRAAALADPLSRLNGIKKKIGEHISINSTPDRYHIIVYKNVPAKALRILCQEIQKHIRSLPRSAHIEMFREVASQYKIVMSAQRLMRVGVKELGRAILELLKRKRQGHYVHIVLLQTVPGGHLMRYEGLY